MIVRGKIVRLHPFALFGFKASDADFTRELIGGISARHLFQKGTIKKLLAEFFWRVHATGELSKRLFLERPAMHREPAHEFEKVGFQFWKRPFQQFPFELFEQSRVKHHITHILQIGGIRHQITEFIRVKGIDECFERAWISTQPVNNSPALLRRNLFPQALCFEKLREQCLGFLIRKAADIFNLAVLTPAFDLDEAIADEQKATARMW